MAYSTVFGRYKYAIVSVQNSEGRPSTISISPAEWREMCTLAKGSADRGQKIDVRVRNACRQAAAYLVKHGYEGTWSAAVRARALNVLRGSYQPSKAKAA